MEKFCEGETVFERVRQIILRQLNVKGMDITPETELLSELRVNSLDLVELICEFELEFGIEIPERDIRRFTRVKDVVSYLEEKCPAAL